MQRAKAEPQHVRDRETTALQGVRRPGHQMRAGRTVITRGGLLRGPKSRDYGMERKRSVEGLACPASFNKSAAYLDLGPGPHRVPLVLPFPIAIHRPGSRYNPERSIFAVAKGVLLQCSISEDWHSATSKIQLPTPNTKLGPGVDRVIFYRQARASPSDNR